MVEVLDPAVRDRRLDELLRKYHASRKNRILVFVLYKKEASRVEAMLSKRGWKVTRIEHLPTHQPCLSHRTQACLSAMLSSCGSYGSATTSHNTSLVSRTVSMG